MKPIRRKSSGFTLIEIMISMTILSMISIFVFQSTSKSFQLRESLTADGDFYNSIRVALDIFSRDYMHTFTPQAASLPGDIGKSGTKKKDGTDLDEGLDQRTYPFWGALVNKNGVRPSRLKGESSQITFVSNSHMRLFKESPECEFAKITYALEDDKLAEKPGSKVFVKHENIDVFSLNRENKDTDVRYVLLSGVKGLRFKYLDGEKDTWFDSWDTTSPDRKNKFPSLVEIEVDIELPKSGNTFTVMQRYKAELPL